MKVLFDACTPRPLRKYLPGHMIHTAQEMGWGRLKNGALLRKAEDQFDAFITTDQNLKYQQDTARERLAILVLPTNAWPVIRSKAHEIAAELAKLKPADFIELRWD